MRRLVRREGDAEEALVAAQQGLSLRIRCSSNRMKSKYWLWVTPAEKNSMAAVVRFRGYPLRPKSGCPLLFDRTGVAGLPGMLELRTAYGWKRSCSSASSAASSALCRSAVGTGSFSVGVTVAWSETGSSLST